MPDPLIPRVPEAEMAADIRDMSRASTALRNDATFFEVMANNPDLLRWYIHGFYGDVFKSGRVPADALEVLRLRLSAQHGCKFCNQGNRLSAREAGLSDAEIDALFTGDVSTLRPHLVPVAELSDALKLTNHQGALTEALNDRLSAHYSPGQIVELGLIGGMLTGIAKFLFAFDLVEREASCPFPQ
jgi:alkylhydroperoxidase family enzyme